MRRPSHQIGEVMGFKSESEVQTESEEKQKKIDHLVTLAEKVIRMGLSCIGMKFKITTYGT